MNILNKTSAYLIGHMESGDGAPWRNVVTASLEPLGIHCFDPYKKPFEHSINETKEYQAALIAARERGDYDYLTKECKAFRREDLNLVDRSDFIIFYYDRDIPTVGSFEEFFWAARQKKVIFFICKQGKKNCPLWIFATIPHRYIYDNIESVIAMIKKIDNGDVKIDSERWRLLKRELR